MMRLFTASGRVLCTSCPAPLRARRISASRAHRGILQHYESLSEIESRLEGASDESTGRVAWAKNGVVGVSGLSKAAVGDLVEFANGELGLIHSLDKSIGCAILLSNRPAPAAGEPTSLRPGSLQVPVGHGVLGRDLNGLGRCVDGDPLECSTSALKLVAHNAPLDRLRVDRQLLTGRTTIDMLAPLGLGQCLLLHGLAGSGKSTAARAIVEAQHHRAGLHCIYVGIGEDASRHLAALPSRLRDCTTTVTCAASDAPGLQYLAPYVASTIAQHSMEAGRWQPRTINPNPKPISCTSTTQRSFSPCDSYHPFIPQGALN